MLETQPRLNVAGQAGNSVNHHAGRLLAPIAQRMWPFPDVAKMKLSGQVMTNDCEAIIAFVDSKSHLSASEIGLIKIRRGVDPTAPQQPSDWRHYLSNTQRAYLKEAERFLLWIDTMQHKTLAQVTPEECAEYRLFLADPVPAHVWCGARGNLRTSHSWRPFEGPLSKNARRCATAILKSLYQFLIQHAYLSSNPWGEK